jgi:hypothetical protein
MAGQEMFSFAGLPELLLRFCINLVVILVLVRWLYYSTTRRKDYLFYLHSHFQRGFPALLPA